MRTHQSKFIPIKSAAISLAVALSLTAGTSAIAGEKDRLEVIKEAHMGLDEAIAAATKEYPGYAVEGELGEHDGMYYYQIDIVSENGEAEVYINPANGVVIGVDQEMGLAVRWQRRWEERLKVLKKASLTMFDAIELVKGDMSAHVVEADLGLRHFGHIYEIKLIEGEVEHEFEVSLEDGRIVDHDIDD